MNSQLLFQRFARDWPELAESLDAEWPAIRDEFIRFAAPLRNLPDDSAALRDFIEGAANRLVELLAEHPAGRQFLTASGDGAIVARLAGSGAGDDAKPSGDAVANQYPPIRKKIVQTADDLAKPRPSGAKSTTRPTTRRGA